MPATTKQSVFLDEEKLEQIEARRQRKVFAIYTASLVLVDFYYGFSDYNNPQLHAATIVLLVLGVLKTINWIVFRWHGRADWGKLVLALLGIVSILVEIPSGGTAGTALLWVLVYPSAAILALGLRRGLILNVIFFASFAIMQAVEAVGLLPSFYTAEQYREVWVAAALMLILGYADESGWSRARDAVVRQRENLRGLLQNLPVGVVVFDAKTRAAVAANGNAAALLGRPIIPTVKAEEEPAAYGFVREDGKPFSVGELPTVRALKEGVTSIRNDIVVRRPDDSSIVLRVVSTPIKDERGQVTEVISVLEDATKEFEVDKMRSEFVSLTSNQIKMPLTGIKWAVGILRSGGARALNVEQMGYIAQIDENVARLTRLANDLLSVSRIETGEKFSVNLKPGDLIPVLTRAVSDIGSSAASRRVKVKLNLPPRLNLIIDAEKIYEVFLNLLSNAVKYSNYGGEINVGVMEGPEGMMTVFVRDEGIGIPASQLARVFVKFFRASNIPETSEGTGLGLYIAQAIVDRHDGRIWFESEEGRGTTFYVALPKSSSQ